MQHPRLYLVRHGESDWNAAGRLLSFTDAPLNARGEGQAAALAADLAGIHWARAIASPRVRARRTAEIVLAARDDSPTLEVDDRLVELSFGPYEGRTHAELLVAAVAAGEGTDNAWLPGMETEEAVAERALAFLASLDGSGGEPGGDASGAAHGATLVVGHGRMLRILIAAALGASPTLARSLRMRNCRPAILEPGPNPLLLALNAGDPTTEAVGG